MPVLGTVVKSGINGVALVRPDCDCDLSGQIDNKCRLHEYMRIRIEIEDTCYVFAVDGDLKFTRTPMFGARPIRHPHVGDRVIMEFWSEGNRHFATFWVYLELLKRAHKRLAPPAQIRRVPISDQLMAQA